MPTKKYAQFRTQKHKSAKLKPNTFISFVKNFQSEQTVKELVKLLNTPFAPVKYSPKEDYYTYINYAWIDEKSEQIKKIDDYYVQVDSFRLGQENVYYELIDIVKEYTKKDHSKQSKLINNIYKSFLNLSTHSAKIHVLKIVDDINNYIDTNNMLGLLAYVNNNEIVSHGCPLVWNMSSDEKNASKYINHISSPSLPLYDYDLYMENAWDTAESTKYKKFIKKEYLAYIDKIFNACLGPNHGFQSIDIFNVEAQMLNAMYCTDINQGETEYYNIITAKESIEKYKFDWGTFSKLLGFKSTPKTFIVGGLNYFKCGTELLIKNWNTPQWKGYWLYIHLKQMIRFSEGWGLIHYEYYGKTIQGQPAPFTRDIYPIFGLSICFNNFLTTQYVEKNKQPMVYNYINKLAVDLKEVFTRKIKRNTWLSPSTKKYALLKLKHLKFIIGLPDVMVDDPLLDYTDNDAWGNLLKITAWRTQKLINLEGKDIVDLPMVDWSATPFKLVSKQSYVVNAFYTSTENSIYIPQAIMQKPFLDLNDRGIECNLAHIGYTFGHEMSHSLDNTGSKYDYKGNLHNWWTPNDRKIFDSKVADIIKQYELVASYDGIKMDASTSTGENMADISGLTICLEYLRDFQIANNYDAPSKALSYQSFFTYFAIQARQKVYNSAIKSQLKINPHPLDKYRTNCPLARSELFKAIYNVKKGDKMYWKSVPIW